MALSNDPAQEVTPVSGTISAKNLDGAGVALTSQANGSARSLDVGITVAGVQVDPRSVRALTATDVVTVAQAAITKGTQGTTGVTTQDLKDAGRNQTNYFMSAPIASTATDTLMSLTGFKSAAAVVATTTPAVVTAGKTYRITSITITYVTIVTTPGAVKFTLRANPAGVAAITSPAVDQWIVGEPSGAAPIAGKFNTITIPFPEGKEFPAATGLGLSMVGLSATGAAAAVGLGVAGWTGFEY